MGHLRKLVWALTLSMVLLGCVSEAQPALRDARMAANTAVLVVETAQSAAELLYKAQQEAALNQAKVQPGATQESVMAAVVAVRQKWAPTIQLFADIRETHKKLVKALEAGNNAIVIAQLMEQLWKQQSALSKQMEQLRGGQP